ncbi:MAG: cytochrome c-type biogenesis protein [Betaproteobacteria bacterium]
MSALRRGPGRVGAIGSVSESWRRLLVVALVAVVSVALVPIAVIAQTGTYNPDTPADPATEARLRDLAQELRCLVCQNQTIADSSADLAVDLRREVRAQILQGKTNAQIKDYLVARYGDFVLYKPPVQGNTALLWFGPFALLAVGGVVWWFFIRRRRAAIAAANAISQEDENRARALLD